MGITKLYTINGVQIYRDERMYYGTERVAYWSDYVANRIAKGISYSRESFMKWCRRNGVNYRWGNAPDLEPEYDDIVEEEFSKVLFIT